MKKRCIRCTELKDLKKFDLKRSKELNPSKQRQNICRSCYSAETKSNNLNTAKITKAGKRNKEITVKFSKELKKRLTVTEKILQKELIGLKIVHFIQYPVYDTHHKYIVDFYIPTETGGKGLVIEIDGKSHESDEMIVKDKNRDDYLHLRKLVVIRVTNEQVKKRIKEIIELILSYDVKYSRILTIKKKDSHTIILPTP